MALKKSLAKDVVNEEFTFGRADAEYESGQASEGPDKAPQTNEPLRNKPIGFWGTPEEPSGP